MNVGDAALASDSVTPSGAVQRYVSASSSGSLLPLPSSVTAAPSSTDRLLPAFAVGARLDGCTVTATPSRARPPCGSRTVSRKRSTVPAVTAGAVNVAVALSASVSSTFGRPSRCVQAYESFSPSGSVPLPASVTASPETTSWSGPALAFGGSLTALTSTITVSCPESAVPSFTVRPNVSE